MLFPTATHHTFLPLKMVTVPYTPLTRHKSDVIAYPLYKLARHFFFLPFSFQKRQPPIQPAPHVPARPSYGGSPSHMDPQLRTGVPGGQPIPVGGSWVAAPPARMVQPAAPGGHGIRDEMGGPGGMVGMHPQSEQRPFAPEDMGKWVAPGEVVNNTRPNIGCPICGRRDFATVTDLEIHCAQCTGN